SFMALGQFHLRAGFHVVFAQLGSSRRAISCLSVSDWRWQHWPPRQPPSVPCLLRPKAPSPSRRDLACHICWIFELLQLNGWPVSAVPAPPPERDVSSCQPWPPV